MGSPDTTPQSEEFARENQFRVELPNVERLYDALGHPYQGAPGTIMKDREIGTSHSENELFSQINAMVVDNEPHRGYSISAELLYQNLSYQYWTKEQVEQLQTSLSQNYGYGSIEHQVDNSYNSLIIKDSDTKLMYVVGLGYKDERTAWESQVKALEQIRNKTDNEDHPIGELLNIKSKLGLFQLYHLVNSPIAINSEIQIKPIDADPDIIGPLDAFPLATIGVFKDRTERWAKFIEDAVNAMAKVKGIPQSGKLSLLPPEDLPQM